MTRISSTEFQQNIGVYSDAAMRTPVVITKRDRDRLVLMSIEDYNRLKALDDRIACHPADLPDDIKEALDMEVAAMSKEDIADYSVKDF
jgi:prevent-host-death family protein